MPIKTTNMAGLQKWEETEDYIIYLCKDATMTTVQNYVTGTFQTFQERISDIESSQELMKSYSIEWSTQDSIDLINEINNEALAKLEATPMLLTENDGNKIQVLSERAVPVTYECCFRMDKKSGEFYIGEGYENLVKTGYSWGTNSTKDTNGNLVSTRLNEASNGYIVSLLHVNKYNVGDIFSVSYENVSGLEYLDRFEINLKAFGVSVSKNKIKDSFTTPNLVNATTNDNIILTFYNKEDTKLKVFTSKIIITKTPTPKPFVKSVMPTGKFAFVTSATSETHSFLIKEAKNLNLDGISINTFSTQQNLSLYVNYQTINGSLFASKDRFFGVNVNGAITNGDNYGTGFIGQRDATYISATNKNSITTFTQLLIYKGNLTEAELKAELAKNIKII